MHGYTKALSVAPLKLAKAMGATTLCTLHDFFSACPNGAFFDYQRGEPCGLKAMSMGCMLRNCDKRSQAHKAYRLARQAAQRWIGGFPASVDAYITLSEFSADKLRPYLPEGRMMRALPNIIEAEKAAPVDVAANEAIVAVGRLDIEKGVRVLMDAARRADVRIRFVGDGPLRDEVDAHPNAEATGWIDAAGVRQELARARCLAFPSLWYEAFGLVVDEASAMGVPSIVSGISAAAERVEHRVSGIVTPGGIDDRSVSKLAEALQQMQDGAFAAQLGREAHTRFWAAPPTRAAHARSLMTIYADALEQRPAAPKQE
jgi:glycosyltransferase involved in cell wall biosynthesis